MSEVRTHLEYRFDVMGTPQYTCSGPKQKQPDSEARAAIRIRSGMFADVFLAVVSSSLILAAETVAAAV